MPDGSSAWFASLFSFYYFIRATEQSHQHIFLSLCVESSLAVDFVFSCYHEKYDNFYTRYFIEYLHNVVFYLANYTQVKFTGNKSINGFEGEFTQAHLAFMLRLYNLCYFMVTRQSNILLLSGPLGKSLFDEINETTVPCMAAEIKLGSLVSISRSFIKKKLAVASPADCSSRIGVTLVVKIRSIFSKYLTYMHKQFGISLHALSLATVLITRKVNRFYSVYEEEIHRINPASGDSDFSFVVLHGLLQFNCAKGLTHVAVLSGIVQFYEIAKGRAMLQCLDKEPYSLNIGSNQEYRSIVAAKPGLWGSSEANLLIHETIYNSKEFAN